MYSLRLLVDVYNTLYCFLLSTYFDVLAIVFIPFYDAPLKFGSTFFLFTSSLVGRLPASCLIYSFCSSKWKRKRHLESRHSSCSIH